MTIKNKEKIKELVRNCKVLRYTTEESLEYLKDNGCEISERTLRRIKKEMNSELSDRLLEIIKTEYSDELLRTFDALKKIQKEYWNLLEQNPTITEKIRIFDAIYKTQESIAHLYTNAENLRKFQRGLDARFEELEQLQAKTQE